MSLIETISGIFLISFLVVIFVSMFFEKVARISPTPSLPWVRRKIIQALIEHLDINGKYKIAELGCGWGGINLILARKFMNSTIAGYEISFFPYVLSSLRAKLGSKRIKIFNFSFFNADLSDYDVIICYLSPWHMNELKPQFELLKPGSLIISNAFAIPEWEPLEILHTHVGMEIPIFVYRVN